MNKLLTSNEQVPTVVIIRLERGETTIQGVWCRVVPHSCDNRLSKPPAGDWLAGLGWAWQKEKSWCNEMILHHYVNYRNYRLTLNWKYESYVAEVDKFCIYGMYLCIPSINLSEIRHFKPLALIPGRAVSSADGNEKVVIFSVFLSICSYWLTQQYGRAEI